MATPNATLKAVRFSGHADNVLSGTLATPCVGVPARGVLLLHGLRSDSREFGDFPKVLAAEGAQVLSFDFSGHGGSEGRPLLVTRESHFDDTLAGLDFIDRAGVTDVTIVGHSFGVYPAIRALAADDRVKRGVFIAPQARSGAGLTGLRHVAFRALSAAAGLAPVLARRAFIAVGKDYGANFSDPAKADWARSVDWDPGRINLGTLAYARRMDNAALAARIAKPVLVVTGDDDRKVSPESSERFVRAIPPSCLERLRLADTGHSPFAPPVDENLVAAVGRFMASGI